jgi:hypothetical protein
MPFLTDRLEGASGLSNGGFACAHPLIPNSGSRIGFIPKFAMFTFSIFVDVRQ